jgi:hypothetical protein
MFYNLVIDLMVVLLPCRTGDFCLIYELVAGIKVMRYAKVGSFSEVKEQAEN